MELLDATAEKCLFVLGPSNKVFGSLTDGDIRRAILAGASLTTSIQDHFNRSPIVVREGDEVNQAALDAMKARRIQVVPIVDAIGCLVRYVTWSDLVAGAPRDELPPLDNTLVIMAGGFGTRLEPFTKVLPKALIPVNEKPIIEHIIDRFVEYGVHDVRLTVNYKSRILKAYFEDRQPEYDVTFIDEPEPLGTAGSLKFLSGGLHQAFFVTNCDIVVEADYRKILKFHNERSHGITLVGSTVHYQIPYGTCVLQDSGALMRIEEKPSYDFLVNTGMYVLEPSVLEFIPSAERFDMTELVAAVLDSGQSVGVFPISEGAWIDVGQWQEFKKAADRL